MNRDNDPRLTGADVPIVLQDENGETIELQSKPFSEKDYDSVDAWLRQEFMARVEESVKLMRSVELKSAAMAQAISMVPTVNMMDRGAGSKLIGTLDGIARLVWQSTRANHGDYTVTKLKSMLRISANRKIAADSWQSTNMPDGRGAPLSGEDSAGQSDTDD